MYRGIIYRFTCKLNNKSYIGQTIRPERRYKDHCKAEGDSYIHNAIRTHGLENFEYVVQENIEANDPVELKHTLNEREQYWISYYDSYNNGYNNTIGGDGSAFWKHSGDHKRFASYAFLGKRHTDETKSILSEKAKIRLSDPTKNGMYGKHHTDEAKQKMREARLGKPSPLKGKHHTDEAKQKNRESHLGMYDGEKNPMYGKSHTDEAKQRISEASKKRWEEFKKSGKPHHCKGRHRVYNDDGTWNLVY